jgi:hypothetical protein
LAAFPASFCREFTTDRRLYDAYNPVHAPCVPTAMMQTDSLFKPVTTALSLGLPSVDAEAARGMPSVAPQPDWHDLVRDISAIANSGGGTLQVDGSVDLEEILTQTSRFTSSDFTDIGIETSQDSAAPTTLNIGASALPIEFAGIVYFRHDGRSEPASAADIRRSFERLLNHVRQRWSRALRHSLNTPVDRIVPRQHKRRTPSSPKQAIDLQPVRITNDPNAPALHPQDVDRLYPWRQKDLVRELNRRFGGRVVNSYDIQATRRHHRLDDHPDFIFNLPGAGRRYSPAAADWIVDQFSRDAEFFHKARAADQEQLKLRRRPK